MKTRPDLKAVISFPSTAPQPAGRGEPPRSPAYGNVRLNALKHGILSKHAVLAHEDGVEFAELLTALVAEHQPTGPTQTHLVEELAGVIWRKRRVLQAEGAVINRGRLAMAKVRHDRALDSDGPARAAVPFEPKLAQARLNAPVELAEALRETSAQASHRILEAEAELAATEEAASIVSRGAARDYRRALKALTPGCAESWADSLAEGEVTATVEDLARFIHENLLPFSRQEVLEARNIEAIKTQALGEGFKAEKLEQLNRYETHLDRKFERTLGMLLRLKQLQPGV